MSDQNRAEGKDHYATGDAETRAWFEDQWKRWPTRVHQERTTNISFHHGGVLAFREIHGRDPELSRDFRGHVAWLDKHGAA
ncbi:MAG TPA: hypothetical protein H9899_07255 [Candidatus Sphingomonas excrementigallinarum]|nr:hypothetical protein [Candidatus Sphingomonas excrementigallinarum]